MPYPLRSDQEIVEALAAIERELAHWEVLLLCSATTQINRGEDLSDSQRRRIAKILVEKE